MYNDKQTSWSASSLVPETPILDNTLIVEAFEMEHGNIETQRSYRRSEEVN